MGRNEALLATIPPQHCAEVGFSYLEQTFVLKKRVAGHRGVFKTLSNN